MNPYTSQILMIILKLKQNKNCSACLEFQQMQPRGKKLATRYLASNGRQKDTDIFMLNNKGYLCIVDYHSKFPVVK